MSEIVLEINGTPYTGFTSAAASKSMTDISGEFTFSVSALGELQKFPIKNGSEARILVDNKPFITGYVEAVDIDYDSNSHQISVKGRDKTCDIVDNTVGGDLSFTAGISLQEIIQKVLESYGLENSIKVSSNVQLDVFDSNELGNISLQSGETAFNFIVKYAAKRQVLTMSDGDGNILLARTPSDEDRLNTILTSSPNYQGTILNAKVSYDNTKRFYKYIILSQQNSVTKGLVTEIGDTVDNAKIVSMTAVAYDEDIRHTRIRYLMQNSESDNEQQSLQDRVQWEANHRMATGFKYTATVQGFSPINDQANIWQPNMLVMINDEYCDILNQLLLIKSVSFKYGLDGSTTTLELIDKDGYSIEALQGVKYKDKKKQAAGKNVSGGIVEI